MRVFLALLLVAVATAELSPLHKAREPIPGKYIVKVKRDSDLDLGVSSVRLTGGKVGNIWKGVLHGFAVELREEIVDVVRSLPFVEYVEEDGVYRTQQVMQVTWGLDRIDQRDTSLNNIYSPHNGDGNGYTVWVIDTGVQDTHIEFGGRARQEKNFAKGANKDCNGHGTHCSGTVGSNTYGVAPGVQIRGVKVLGCSGSGSTSGVVSGINYVRDNADGHSVASMSLGGGASTAMDDAVNDLVRSGVPTAVAAGNENSDACNSSPARASQATTVGATTSTDARSSFSNWGSCVDIFAPGSSITSTWHSSDTATNTISGTSMACPHVAGALALYGNTDDLLSQATSGAIIDAGTDTPNLLLYV